MDSSISVVCFVRKYVVSSKSVPNVEFTAKVSEDSTLHGILTPSESSDIDSLPDQHNEGAPGIIICPDPTALYSEMYVEIFTDGGISVWGRVPNPTYESGEYTMYIHPRSKGGCP